MKTAISLGWACFSTMYGVHTGLRERKSSGYKTCPFDLMLTNIEGVLDCIRTDFEDFLNLNYFDCTTHLPKEYFPVNTKYDFKFNHEGFDNFIGPRSKIWAPEYQQKFLDRYNTRVDNFRYYCNNAEYITFIAQESPSDLPSNKIVVSTIEQTIQEAYPKLDFGLIVLPPQSHPEHPDYNDDSEWYIQMTGFQK